MTATGIGILVLICVITIFIVRRDRSQKHDPISPENVIDQTADHQQIVLDGQRNTLTIFAGLQKMSANEWDETLNSISDIVTITDLEYNIIYANRAARTLLGITRSEKEEQKCYRYYHGKDAPPDECPSCQCLKTEKPTVFELFEPHLNRHVEIRALPRISQDGIMTGLIHIARDISDRKAKEARINTQMERLRSLRMIDITISASLDLRLTLDIFLEQVKSRLHADAVSVMLFNPDTQILRYAASKGFRTGRIEKVSMRIGQSCAGQVILSREKVLYPDLSDMKENSPAETSDFFRSFLIKEEGFQAYCGIPLIAKGSVNGVLEVFHRVPFFPDDDWIEFLEALAGQGAIALDNAKLFAGLQHSRNELMNAYDTTIEGWSMALDLRDRETEGHSRRVSDMTVRIASEIGVDDEEMTHIRWGALLHDIGKIGVPDSVLLKGDRLTGEEWEVMRQHPDVARSLLSRIPFLHKAIDIPYCHHEKWDGTGYPRGLKGEEIPYSARIFAIADIYDALSSDRPYRRAWKNEDIIEYICALSGTHLDPGLVEVFFASDWNGNVLQGIS